MTRSIPPTRASGWTTSWPSWLPAPT